MSKSVAIVSSGASTSILIPSTPTLTFAVVSLHSLSGKSSLCQRLTNENFDQYRSFALKTKSTEHRQTICWFYWGSIKHRRSDDKREAFCHFIEHSSVAIDQHEHYETYLKRISTLTFRCEEKYLHSNEFPQIRTFPKDKIHIDGFLCLHDLSTTNEQKISDLFFLLHGLMKTRRPVILITTKNDLIEHQAELAAQFEQTIRRSHPNIPILHSSANENVNIRSILDVLLFVTDDLIRKSSSANIFPSKSFSISYDEALRNEQSLRKATISQFRTLLNRNVTDYRQTSWTKFYQTWQHHNVIRTTFDLCGKEQIERIFLEHLDELKRNERKKLLDERLIPIIELLITDPNIILSRNWDYVRLQMQEHPEYSSTVIPTAKWSDEQKEKSLCIPVDLLETSEARHCFQTFLNQRQLEQTRRTHCRAFFDLLNRFADAGLVQYGHSFEKDSVYFLGRESFEALNFSDRHRVFAFHQSYLYRLLCLKFVELLFESFEIFIETFRKMNLATTQNERKFTTISIDEIFEKEIIQQIKHEPRYQMLNNRATDRHRLIMCHCHFLYDCIYYPPIRNLTRLIKQRKRSFKRQKSSSQSLYGVNMNIEENFCPYTRKIPLANSDEKKKKKFEIGCPMEDSCADVRIMNEFFGKKSEKRNILICGNENETKKVFDVFVKHSSLTNDYQINILTMKTMKNSRIDGCLIVSNEGRTMIDERRWTNEIPIVDLSNRLKENLFDEIRSSCEEILFNNDQMFPRRSFDLRILLVFMCGGETNDVESFFSQLSSNFPLKVTNERGETSFIVQTYLNRTHRQIELIPVSFHSLFSFKFNEFDGFVLFYDRDRKAAMNTMTTLEKQISKYFQNDLKREKNRAPIYLLSVIKDFSYSTFQSYPQTNFCVQCHSGTLRNFVKYHFVPFLNQCALEKAAQRLMIDELTSNFSLTRPMRSSTSDLLTSTFERSLKISSHSNDHSPRNPSFSLTPTNTSEQIFSSRSYPYLSLSTIVPTTPVDPSVTNLGLLTENSPTNFKKSTSMKFAKLIEHPINHLTFNDDRNSYQSTSNEMNNGFVSLTTTNRRINEIASDNMKFHLYKHRTAAHVKVPLATPEIIEFNESIARPFTIEQHDDQSIVLTNQNTSETTSSSSPAIHQQQQRDSSIDSSSDEIEENSKDTSLVLQNLNAPTNNKISDRKTKRVRTNLISSKKTASDDEEKRRPTEQYQKKKRRPSFKRRKKVLYDQTLTDSGIDARMDGKDSTKTSITTEPSSSSNIVISNEEDSSIGDLTKDSKNTSIEELEERPTANWIRRQLQHFAQARRDKNRSPAGATATVTSICSPPIPSFKATMTATPPNSHANVSPLSSVENSHHHHPPLRLTLSRCAQSSQTGVPLFIEKCIEYIEEFGLAVEGLYRVSGYKNQVDLVINRLIEDPTYDLRTLQVPASAVATALKDMMRKLDEPLLSLDFFDECQNMTIEQLRSEEFLPLRKALSRTTDLKFRTIKFIFKHLHFVSQHAASTHMDSSNLAVLWWPNLFQPQFRDLRTAEQTCQKAKPLIQAIIDNYSLIFDRTF